MATQAAAARSEEKTAPVPPLPLPDRVLSVDVFRGLTMFFLVAEGAGVYRALLASLPDGTLLYSLATQFTHHPWSG